MPKSTLSPTDQAELARLLRHVGEKDKGFLPNGCYEPYCAVRPLAFIEILPYRSDGSFLLKRRRDEHFTGWHVPGGSLLNGESVAKACDRHIRADKAADGVTDLRAIGVHLYGNGEHPYCHPYITLIACTAVGEVIERDDCRWFKSAPADMIQNAPHTQYIKRFLAWFQAGCTEFTRPL